LERERSTYHAAAFDFMRHLCPTADASTTDDMIEDMSSWRDFKEELSQYLNIVEASVSLSYLWSRPWFSRVWVVQEMLATDNLTFRSGKNAIETEIFFRRSLRFMQSSYISALTMDCISLPDRIHFKNCVAIYQIRLKVRDMEAEHDTHLIDMVNWTRSLKSN
jgi:hypothetical protein